MYKAWKKENKERKNERKKERKKERKNERKKERTKERKNERTIERENKERKNERTENVFKKKGVHWVNIQARLQRSCSIKNVERKKFPHSPVNSLT